MSDEAMVVIPLPTEDGKITFAVARMANLRMGDLSTRKVELRAF